MTVAPVAPVVVNVMSVMATFWQTVWLLVPAPEESVIVFVGFTARLLLLVAVPLGVVTLTVPVVAPLGIVAAIVVELVTENAAAVPLKLTAVAPVKLVPEIVIELPGQLFVGEKLVIVGGGV